MPLTITFKMPSPVALTLAEAHRDEITALATTLSQDLNFGFADYCTMINALTGSVAHIVDVMTATPSYLDRVPGAHRDGSCSPECDIFRDTRLTGPDAYSLIHDSSCPNLPPEGN